MLFKQFIKKKNLFSLDQWVARTVVAVFGKALSEASCTIMYLYTAELYPTVIRSVINSVMEQQTITILFIYSVVTTYTSTPVSINFHL